MHSESSGRRANKRKEPNNGKENELESELREWR